jgi:type I restriction enzyme S subunit
MDDLILGDSLEMLLDHRGKTPKKLGGDFADAGVPVASAILVKDGRLDLNAARTVSQEIYARWMPEATRKGDVLLTSEAPLGRVARVTNDEPLVLGQRLFGLRGKKGVLDSRYLFYALQSERVQSDLIGRATGTTVLGIRQSALRGVVIPAPSLPEQVAVAEILGALDDKVDANRRVAHAASRLAAMEYSRGTAMSPMSPMSQSLVPHLGGTPSRANKAFWKDGTHAWVSVKDMTAASGGVLLSTAEQITDAAIRNNRTSLQPEGSVLLSARGTVGKVVRLGIAAAINQSCYAFAPGTVPAGCLFHMIKGVAAQAKALAHGSVFDTITMGTFDHLSVPDLAPAEWDALEERISPLLASVVASERESQKLVETRDDLLPLLVSGKLRVRDAERKIEEVL